jgi:hypothetical protein
MAMKLNFGMINSTVPEECMVLYQRRITVADSEKSNDKDLRKRTVKRYCRKTLIRSYTKGCGNVSY